MARHLGLRIGRHWTLAIVCDREQGAARLLPPSLTRAVTIQKGLRTVLAREAIHGAGLDAAVIEVTDQVQLVPDERGPRIVPWVHGAAPGLAAGVSWSRLNEMNLAPDVLGRIGEEALRSLVARLEELTGLQAMPFDSLTVVLAAGASTEMVRALRDAVLAQWAVDAGAVHEATACAGLALAPAEALGALDSGGALVAEVAAPRGAQSVAFRRDGHRLLALVGAEEATGRRADRVALRCAVHDAARNRRAQAVGACLLGRARQTRRLALAESVPLRFHVAVPLPGEAPLPLHPCSWRRHVSPARRLSWIGLRASDELRGALPLTVLACVDAWPTLRPVVRLMLMREDVVQRESRRFVLSVDAPFGAGDTVVRISDDQGKELARSLVASLDSDGAPPPPAANAGACSTPRLERAFADLPLAEPHPWQEDASATGVLSTDGAPTVVPAGWAQRLPTGLYHAGRPRAARLTVTCEHSVRHRWDPATEGGGAPARELHIGPFSGLSDTHVAWVVLSWSVRDKRVDGRFAPAERIRIERPYYGLRADVAWSGDASAVVSPLATANDGQGVPVIEATGVLAGEPSRPVCSLGAMGQLTLVNLGGETLQVRLLVPPGLRIDGRSIQLAPSSQAVVRIERRRATTAREAAERTALDMICRVEPVRSGRVAGPSIDLAVPLRLDSRDAPCQLLPPLEPVRWNVHTWVPPGTWSLRGRGTGRAPTRVTVRLGRPADPIELEARVSALESEDGTWEALIMLLAQPVAVVQALRARLDRVRGRLLIVVGDEQEQSAEVEFPFELNLRGALAVPRRLALTARTGDDIEVPVEIVEAASCPDSLQAVAEVEGDVPLRLGARLEAGLAEPSDDDASAGERLEDDVLDANREGLRRRCLRLDQQGVTGFEGGANSGVIRLLDGATGIVLDEVPFDLTLVPIEPQCTLAVRRTARPAGLRLHASITNPGTSGQRFGIARIEVRLRVVVLGLPLGLEVVGARTTFAESRVLAGGKRVSFSREVRPDRFGRWRHLLPLASALDVEIVIGAAGPPPLGGGRVWTIRRRLRILREPAPEGDEDRV
jgi:hypothetical protein